MERPVQWSPGSTTFPSIQPNTSCDYVPGTVDFSTTGNDYISATGGSNTLPNPDLKQNKNYEASVRLDRQLVANVGVGFGYVYHRHTNWYGTGECECGAAVRRLECSGCGDRSV